MRKHILIPLAILLLCGCTKQAIQATYDKQETTIDNLVQSLTSKDEAATVEYLGGAVRVRFSDSTSTESDEALKEGGKVSFYYGGFMVTSASLSYSNMFATNLEELATAAGWKDMDESMFAVETVTVGKGELVPGLEKGLIGVKKGDDCIIVFSGKYGWGNHAKGTVPARSALAYQIWVTEVTNE
jgi:hypothetical protein